MDFEIAVLRGRVVEFNAYADRVVIIKDCKRKSVSHELFNDMFHVLDNASDAALKEDCIFFKDVDDGVLIRNIVGDEMVIPLCTFLENYIV